uniref:Uncharacterized protein n=1 Tax=viral metagenome TaxID=1070528 RepID=A0A6H1ZJC6_9ZZZZ
MVAQQRLRVSGSDTKLALKRVTPIGASGLTLLPEAHRHRLRHHGQVLPALVALPAQALTG